MKGGIGTADLQMSNGLIVGTIVAVNAAGPPIDRHTGRPTRVRARLTAGRIEDPFALLRRGASLPGGLLENTTLAVVATNARLTKAQALKVAQMAQDGLARFIVPSHTTNDGDTLFVLATGSLANPGDPDATRIVLWSRSGLRSSSGCAQSQRTAWVSSRAVDLSGSTGSAGSTGSSG